LSLRILIDEDAQDHTLVAHLRRAGHDLLTVNEAGLRERPDEQVLAWARTEGRIVLTRNVSDFRSLAVQVPDHAGVVLIYTGENRSRRMSRREIVAALERLEASGVQTHLRHLFDRLSVPAQQRRRAGSGNVENVVPKIVLSMPWFGLTWSKIVGSFAHVRPGEA
jgi:predicted nuclease of predicted toxin-antitoxin system